MKNNQLKKNRLIIENLDNLQTLTPEMLSSIRGSLSIAYPELEPKHPRRPSRPKFDYPFHPRFPRHPGPKWPKHPRPQPRPYPQPIPCSPYPTKDGGLPWCAVIL